MFKNCLIVGGGAVGIEFHLPRLFKILGSKSITVVDNSDERCQLLQKKFSGDRNILFTTEMPESDFDIAVIATPPNLHLPIYERIDKYSRNIIIEKPLALTVAEGTAIENLSRNTGNQVFVCLIRRALQHFRMIADWWKEGIFGDLTTLRVTEGNVFNWNAVSIGSFSREQNGGGVLMDTGPHTIDQIYQVFESVSLIRAEMDAPVTESRQVIEANVFLELEADSGIPVYMMLSRNRKLSNTAVFQFEKADVTLGLHNNLVEIKSRAGTFMTGFPGGLQTPMNFMDLFDAYYTNFVARGDNSEVSPEIAIKSLRIIEQAYKNAGFSNREF